MNGLIFIPIVFYNRNDTKKSSIFYIWINSCDVIFSISWTAHFRDLGTVSMLFDEVLVKLVTKFRSFFNLL